MIHQTCSQRAQIPDSLEYDVGAICELLASQLHRQVSCRRGLRHNTFNNIASDRDEPSPILLAPHTVNRNVLFGERTLIPPSISEVSRYFVGTHRGNLRYINLRLRLSSAQVGMRYNRLM